MIILGIETSCDETAIAVLEQKAGRVQILSNIVATSLEIQSNFGGVFPEQAAREQLKSIIPVLDLAITQAFPKLNQPDHLTGGKTERSPVGGDERGAPVSDTITNSTAGGKTEGSRRRARSTSEDGRRETVLTGPVKHIDAIAVTQGPGLIGSLLIGVETAKALSLVWQKPLIPINHLIAHFYANWVEEPAARSSSPLASKANSQQPTPIKSGLIANSFIPRFPALGLLVSGGHTDLVLFQNHLQYTYLGGTRDDAAGECFDKCARLLGLPYPGGPQISARAALGNPKAYLLPKPMYGSKNLDLSFSGLKTAVVNLVDQLTDHHHTPLTNPQINDLAASIEYTICQLLVHKTITAIKQTNVTTLMVAGGVAANKKLRELFKSEILNSKLEINLHIPPINLCTDNGVSTAAAGFFTQPLSDPLSLEADPNLSLSN